MIAPKPMMNPACAIRRLGLAALLLAAAARPLLAVDGPAANRMALEKSPYLRLHAADPVDWYPWGPEAFELARRLDRPVFLSIGYSTCHWCHVMERESYSDPAVAALLNKSFVCILVDREERPDVDRVYMAFVQSSTGGGGWPLSVWLTPGLKPFLGGTYYPPQDEAGQPGFKSVIARVAALWASQKDKILQSSDQMLAALAEDTKASASGETPYAELHRRALAQIEQTYDAVNGGFEEAPKFPQPAILEFLLDASATSPDAGERAKAKDMALASLRALDAGAIHDHLGGGFHRYSVDAHWRLPHFEKMLYDQAQLAVVLLEGWQVSGDPSLRDAARDTLGYMGHSLLEPPGGFAGAEDADSPSLPGRAGGAEGAFYAWTQSEVESVLGPADAPLFEYAYGVEQGGNVDPEVSADFAGVNILRRAHSAKEAAARFRIGEDAARAALDSDRRKLAQAREARPKPARDDKVITAWNGLAISAFARAAQILGDPGYAATAEHAASFLQANLYDPGTGRIARSYRDGSRDDRGFAEDYSFLVQGLLDLYEATFEVRWLDWAARLQEKQVALFADPAGGFFADTGDDPSVLLRMKDDSDGVEPSASSVAVRNLARLSELLNRPDWRALAGGTVRSFGSALDRSPAGLPLLVAADGWLQGSPKQILIHGSPGDPDTGRLVGEAWKAYLPRHILVRIDAASRAYFQQAMPVVADFPADGGRAMAYVCENFACQLPTADPAVLGRLLAAPPQAAR